MLQKTWLELKSPLPEKYFERFASLYTRLTGQPLHIPVEQITAAAVWSTLLQINHHLLEKSSGRIVMEQSYFKVPTYFRPAELLSALKNLFEAYNKNIDKTFVFNWLHIRDCAICATSFTLFVSGFLKTIVNKKSFERNIIELMN